MLSTGCIDFYDDADELLEKHYAFLDKEVTSDNRNAALLYDLQRSLETGKIGRIV
jgi:hypothetical protein